jgi:hypothetical protein
MWRGCALAGNDILSGRMVIRHMTVVTLVWHRVHALFVQPGIKLILAVRPSFGIVRTCNVSHAGIVPGIPVAG